jgi:hypothetical protein
MSKRYWTKVLETSSERSRESFFAVRRGALVFGGRGAQSRGHYHQIGERRRTPMGRITLNQWPFVLLSCASKKLPHPALAKDLYVSTLFQLGLRYAQSMHPDLIFILSAKYGLVDPNQRLEPYNETLNTKRDREVRFWAETVLQQLRARADLDRDTFIFLAGEKYRRHLIEMIKHYQVPLSGLTIGRQLQYLSNSLGHAKRV